MRKTLIIFWPSTWWNAEFFYYYWIPSIKMHLNLELFLIYSRYIASILAPGNILEWNGVYYSLHKQCDHMTLSFNNYTSYGSRKFINRRTHKNPLRLRICWADTTWKEVNTRSKTSSKRLTEWSLADCRIGVNDFFFFEHIRHYCQNQCGVSSVL